jgi:hypothetical protein
MLRLETLAEVFAQVKDHRDPRGRRHPLPAILSLMFLGLLARIRELAVLQRWAQAHWDVLQEPLGFDREQPPHATTISRAVAGCQLEEFEQAFLAWLKDCLPDEPFIGAVPWRNAWALAGRAKGRRRAGTTRGSTCWSPRLTRTTPSTGRASASDSHTRRSVTTRGRPLP